MFSVPNFLLAIPRSLFHFHHRSKEAGYLDDQAQYPAAVPQVPQKIFVEIYSFDTALTAYKALAFKLVTSNVLASIGKRPWE